MAQINVTVNGRSYMVGCDDGQERHVGNLAEYVDKRVRELAESVGQVGEGRLLLLATLLLADELSDLFERIETLERQAGRTESATESGTESFAAADIAALAERLETVADRLESH